MMQNYYDVLGVSSEASQASIRTTYLRLLQIYHPDHNSDANASKKTAEIIEAYETLGSPTKRAAYDSSRSTKNAGPENSGVPNQRSDEQSTPIIVCQQCGIQNATLRISQMFWVASLLLVTRRGVRQGIWCERCTAKEAAIWSCVAGLCGWWGFPWGPIHTLPALYFNAIGGKRDRAQNAGLLRLVGFQLYQRNLYKEAISACESSLRMETDEATKTFRDLLQALCHSPKSRTVSFYRAITVLPSLAVCALIYLLFASLSDQPTGYASRYQPTSDAPRVTKPIGATNTRGRVNELVEQLASAVEANATPTGSHQQGTTTIRDFELDRAKYQASPFETVSIELQPLLGDRPANADGFVSSAYFNAKLMGLSVSILNEDDEGQDISAAVSEVASLQRNTYLRSWLMDSKYSSSYQVLETQLAVMIRRQRIGMTRSMRQEKLTSLKAEIEEATVQVNSARNIRDSEREHLWVSTHNNLVHSYNSLLKEEKTNEAVHSKVDLAFNRCLDPAILMSKYQQVNLTAGAEKIDSVPDN